MLPLKPGQQGAISYRATKSGGWEARARLKLFSGAEIQVSRSRTTKAGARLALQDAIAEQLQAPTGSADLKSDSRVGLAARQWITDLRAQSEWPNPPIRAQTVDEYERLLANHVVPALGKRRLNELSPSVCQAWVNAIVEGGKGRKHGMVVTANQAGSVFKRVLDRAVVHDALRINPMLAVKLPQVAAPVPRALTAIEVYRLRRAVRDWEVSRVGKPGPPPTGILPAAVDVMLGTGLRVGEVLALLWEAVDLTAVRPTVTVEATLVDVKGKGTLRQEMPKTKAGERTIILPPFTVEALLSLRPVGVPDEWPVFPARQFKNAGGPPKPRTTSNVRSNLRQALDLAGVTDHVYPHLLRSTVATFVARKMSVADAGALLGHKADSSVTTRHYIEQLRVAPDTSAVLQTLIEIGEAEGRAEETGGWEEVAPEGGEVRVDDSGRRAGARTRRQSSGRSSSPPSESAPNSPTIDSPTQPVSRHTTRPAPRPSAAYRAAERWLQGELDWGA